jgi:probable HAF family extracellular repeat protein
MNRQTLVDPILPLTWLTNLAFFITLALPVPVVAQHHHYQLIDIGTFGGPSSYLLLDSQMQTNSGKLIGWADTSAADSPQFCFSPGDGYASVAFQWHDGMFTNLGVLPGGTSSQATWISSNGLIVGNSQNGEIDPLLPGFPESRAVVWRKGQITDLGTFGGNESIAYAVNSRGQVAGAALNDTPDQYSMIDFLLCGSSNGTQARAFLWQNGMKQDLGTLGTGHDALAFFVNHTGQVAGMSYTNSVPNPTTGLPTFHPFLWEKDKGMRDLGSFGGTQVWQIGGLNQKGQVVGSLTLPGDATFHPFLWDGKKLRDLGTFGGDMGYANWINDAGEIVGQAALPQDQTFHGFYWKNGTMNDLGVLPGDLFSDTSYINSKSQIVGLSGNSLGLSRAVLWESGQVFDLNDAVRPGSEVMLSVALSINDSGEIAAIGQLPNSDQHAYLLIPCDESHPNVEGCDYRVVEGNEITGVGSTPLTQKPTIPNQGRLSYRGVRNSMQSRFGARSVH